MRVAGTTNLATKARVVRRDQSTTILLIRHAHTHALDRVLAGRQLGITLSGVGVLEAEELGRTLRASCRLAAIYSSPLERARETASAIARHQHAHVDVCDALNEIDFGAWTGRTFDDLDRDPQWHAFNRRRATTAIPDGEHLHAAQRRIVAAVTRLAARHRGETIALVSHAEMVRSALLHYRGESLDGYQRLEIAPASVSAVTVWPSGAHVLFINRRAAALGP